MKTYSGYHIYKQVANLEQDDMRRLVLVEPGRVLSLYATDDLPTIAVNFRVVDELLMIRRTTEESSTARVLLLEFYC
jgi:hypothetical protein